MDRRIERAIVALLVLWAIAIVALVAMTPAAHARGYHGAHHHRHYRHHRVSRPMSHGRRKHQAAHTAALGNRGLLTIQTEAGRITVASHLAPRFKALIADFAKAGYHPRRVGCFATSGHVRHSRHYAGAACDFDGSLSRSAFMRSATAHRIIVAHGFRDGCSFRVHGIRDCGHVDDGGGRRVRYARRGRRSTQSLIPSGWNSW